MANATWQKFAKTIAKGQNRVNFQTRHGCQQHSIDFKSWRVCAKIAYLLNVLTHIVQVIWTMAVENIYRGFGRRLEKIDYIDRAAAIDHDD